MLGFFKTVFYVRLFLMLCVDGGLLARNRPTALDYTGKYPGHQLRLVVHTFMSYHQDQVTIRIISARSATRHEQKQYEG